MIKIGQEVEIYFNLHKHVFSIRDKKTKLVMAHAKTVSLKNAQFKVSKKGQERVRKEKKKNVHAYIVGNFLFADNKCHEITDSWKSAYYNPYITETFIDLNSKQTLTEANMVICQNKKVYYQ